MSRSAANQVGEGNFAPELDMSGVDRIYKSLYMDITISEAEIAWGDEPKTKGRKDIIDDLANILIGDVASPINIWRSLLNEFITVRIASRIREVEQTTRDRIAVLIERGIANGDGASEVAKSIREDRGYNRNRSLAIARTETVTAANQGKYLAAYTSPYEKEKRWLPTVDSRTRASHRAMLDTPWIPLEDDFWLANAKGMLEPAQYPCANTMSASNIVNCRCSLSTRTKFDANGPVLKKSLHKSKKGGKLLFTTEIKAIDPKDGKLKTWGGEVVEAETWEEAEQWCQENGKGYLKVTGKFIEEIEN